jgi:hypothetical protein
MSDTPKKPHYAAVLRSHADQSIELTPIAIAEAQNNNDAFELGARQAIKWLTENGIDRAVLQVIKDGASIGMAGVRRQEVPKAGHTAPT